MEKTINGISLLDIPCPNSKTLPLLILHGWMQNKESWMDIMESLKGDMRVICPDLPGFGKSKSKKFLSYSPEDYANDIYEMLKVIGVDKVNILAHSFGGRITIALTKNHPEVVNKIILFSSAGVVLPSVGSAIYRVILNIGNIFPESLKIKIKNYLHLGSRDYNSAGELKEVFIKAINYNVIPYLKDINKKVLIVWGDKDREIPINIAYIFKNNIDNSQLKILKNYGHFAHLEAPNLFVTTILNFLRNE